MRSKPHILIVEDDVAFRETLEEILREDGHAVLSAQHGAEGLARLPLLDRPALVLLDVQMPVLDGVGFLAALQGRAEGSDLEIVVMSAAIHLDWFRGTPGVVRRMRKPMDADAVLAVARDFTRRRLERRPARDDAGARSKRG